MATKTNKLYRASGQGQPLIATASLLTWKIRMSTIEPTLRTANDSGFPLQIALENQVRRTSEEHGWSVRYSEHSWSTGSGGQSGFIDMVLQDRNASTFAVVECKRLRDTEWVFLHSDGRAPIERSAKGWVSHYASGSMANYGWIELNPYPSSVEAHFCAIRGQSSSDRTNLLERVSSELITATEALAAEERDWRHANTATIRFYLNVIVTTAELKVGTFDPLKVSLADGTMPQAEFESVPYLRFRKQFSTRQMRFTPEQYDGQTNISDLKQHTVFVVRADALPRFLAEFRVPDSSLRQFERR